MDTYLKVLYAYLGVSENASLEEIEEHFQKIKLNYINGNQDEIAKEKMHYAQISYNEIIKKLQSEVDPSNNKVDQEPNENIQYQANQFSQSIEEEETELVSKFEKILIDQSKEIPDSSFRVEISNDSTNNTEKESSNENLEKILNVFKNPLPNSNMNLNSVHTRSSTENGNSRETNSNTFENGIQNQNEHRQLDNKEIQTENIQSNDLTKPTIEIKSPDQKPKPGANRKKAPTPFVRQRKIVPKCPPIEQEVQLTLEEVFNGGTKMVKVKRKMEIIGKVLDEEKELLIEIYPGIETDTQIVVAQEGNKSVKALPGDAIFIIKDKPNRNFKRVNQINVEYTAQVVPRLDGDMYEINVPMFDSEPLVLNVELNEINENKTKIIYGRGLPRKDDINSRGNVLVHFEFVDKMDEVVDESENTENTDKLEEDAKIVKQDTPIDKCIKHQNESEDQKQNETENKIELEQSEKPEEPVLNRYKLDISLGEFLNGCKKEIEIERKRFDQEGTEYFESKTFSIEIKPGCQTGTQFTFNQEGDQSEDGTFVDVIFTVCDIPHPYFTRKGSDIKYVCKISQNQLTNLSQVIIPTLDNTTMKITLNEEIVSSMEKRFFGRGLPYPCDTRMRGGFLVKFEIVSEDEANEIALQILNKIEENKKEAIENSNASKDTNDASPDEKQIQLPPNEYNIMLSLEEIYRGCVKRHKIERKIFNAKGVQEDKEAFLEVPVKPGSMEGTKITIEKAGDKADGKIQGDVIFTVHEDDHTIFQRNGLDINYTANITPQEAILGSKLKVPTLNNETITVVVNKGITPKTVQTIPRYGMPNLDDPSERGNLLIHFNIIFGKDPQQSDGILKYLELSLEQILYGDIVGVSFNRNEADQNRNRCTIEKHLNIDVKPGTETGTKYTFPREGDQEPGKIPADIVFVVKDKPHDIFKRNGANLEYTAKIKHGQLVNGGKIEIPTLGNETKSIYIDGIKEDSVKKVSKCGLPLSDNPEKRGDILVRFEIIPDSKDPDVEHILPLTLENILKGCTKRLKINRRFYKTNKKEDFEDKIVVIDVKPGTVEGTTYRFTEYGDENVGSTPADVVFVARDKPDLNFKREGADIIYQELITENEHSNNIEIKIPTLDKDTVYTFFTKDASIYNKKKVIEREGLPLEKTPSMRGNLIVNFKIVDNNWKVPEKIINLPLSLENILFGFSKSIEIERKIIDLNGLETIEKKSIPIDIKPGMDAGTTLIFSRQGDSIPGLISGDVVFVTTDKQHDVFERDGSNLKYKVKITKKKASGPFELEIPLLNESPKTLYFKGATKNTNREIYGKGLPISTKTKFRGNIIVWFEIIDEKEPPKSQNNNASTIHSEQKPNQKPIKQEEKYQRKSSKGEISNVKTNLNVVPEITNSNTAKSNLEYDQGISTSFEQDTKSPVDQDDPFYYEVGLTLSEILIGGIKKVPFQRKTIDLNGKETLENIDLEWEIPPGVKANAEFKIEKAGDKNPDRIPGDVIIVVKEIQHEHFRRNGVDLLYTAKISHFDSLMGFERYIPKLEIGSSIRLKVDYQDPVNSGSVKIFEGYGLPYLENPEKRGNIVVNFEPTSSITDSTDFQKTIEAEQEKQNEPIKQILELPLETILLGSQEKINIKIKVDENKIIKRVDKIVVVDVRPGVATGDKIVIEKQGHQFPEKIPSDVIFVVKDKQHDKFKRNGANIEYTAQISSKQISDGGQIQVPTLENNETIPITVHNQIKLDTVITIAGRGLPLSDNATRRGDLIIRFEICDKNKAKKIEKTPKETKQEKPKEESLQKSPPIIINLEITLDEINKGCVRKPKFQRTIIDSKGNKKIESKNVKIFIKPGTETEKNFTFEGEGNQLKNMLPGDAIFIVHDAPHRYFKRRGADVLYRATISSIQAKSKGCVIKIPTIDHSTLMCPINEEISPESFINIKDKGLPFPDESDKRGRLILLFNIDNYA